jgi:predicted P-loop ATPase
MIKSNGQAPTGSKFDYALSEQNYQTQHSDRNHLTQLKALGYGDGDMVYYRAIKKLPDDKSDVFKLPDRYPHLSPKLEELNQDRYSIYFVVNGGGDSDCDVREGKAVFYEHDDLEKEVQLYLWETLNLPEPTFQLDTGGKSIHSYWVFEQPIDVELWRSLQTDLLNYSDGDKSIKNPSRVMRLAGFKHPSTGLVSEIVSNSGKKYCFDDIRSIVPQPVEKSFPQRDVKPSRKPIDNSSGLTIPILRLLTKEHRSILSGVSQGGRNATGASLARDLIGVAAMGSIECDYRGKDYTLQIEGDAEDLFYSYCAGCSPSLSQHEGAEIWRKAQNSDREPCIRDEEILKNCARSYLKELFPAPGRPKKQKPVIDRDYVSLGKRMGINLPAHGVDEDGVPTSKLLKLELDLLDLYGSRIEFNEMSREIELDRQPIDLNNAKEFVSRSLFYDSRTEECIIALNTIATNHKYHPVREYLNSVRGKAPKDFAKQIPLTYWGNDDELQNKLFFKKLVATVARMENPGSKDDSLLILQGKQGFGKSTGLKVLSGEDWFNDDLRSLEDKDELAKLSRFWLLELAEVDYLFGKKEIELFKRFLSATEDTFRPPYGRANIRIKRACSFFASTNKSEFLADPTGDRRYWVVEVNQNIDIEGLRRDRDLIWAAALDAYESGEKWWLEGDEMKTHAAANEVWRDDDPWGEPILSKIGLVIHCQGSIEYVRIQEIMDNILNIPLERQDKRTRNRIGATLQANGFTLKSTNIGGKKAKVWVKDIGTQGNPTKKDEFQPETYSQIEGTQGNSSNLSLETLEINLINSCAELKEETKSELINNCFPEVVENWVHLRNLSSTGEESLLCAEHSRNSTRNSTQKDEFQTKKMSSREPKIGDRVRYVGQSQMHRGSIGSIVSAENNLYDCDFMGMPAKGLTRDELEVAA